MCRDCYEKKPRVARALAEERTGGSAGRVDGRSVGSVRTESAEGGFSLVEVLIASVLLLVIALGVVPLFVRAIGLNQEGQAASEISTIASSELERLNQLPWDSPDLTIPNGQNEVLVEQYQLEPKGEWKPDTDVNPDDGFHYHRILRLRQFTLGALADGKLDDAERLPGGTEPESLIQIKEFVVQVESGKRIGAARRQVTMRLMRSI